jgi:metal-responsive CopG/Arc/MetJ family transcriptional regulator
MYFNMRNDMTTLSINLPDTLAKASQEAASEMGISRTEFIRQAVAHELKQFKAAQEEKAMVASMVAMKNAKCYLKESEDITDKFNTDLPKDKNEWWHKKKS